MSTVTALERTAPLHQRTKYRPAHRMAAVRRQSRRHPPAEGTAVTRPEITMHDLMIQSDLATAACRAIERGLAVA